MKIYAWFIIVCFVAAMALAATDVFAAYAVHIRFQTEYTGLRTKTTEGVELPVETELYGAPWGSTWEFQLNGRDELFGQVPNPVSDVAAPAAVWGDAVVYVTDFFFANPGWIQPLPDRPLYVLVGYDPVTDRVWFGCRWRFDVEGEELTAALMPSDCQLLKLGIDGIGPTSRPSTWILPGDDAAYHMIAPGGLGGYIGLWRGNSSDVSMPSAWDHYLDFGYEEPVDTTIQDVYDVDIEVAQVQVRLLWSDVTGPATRPSTQPATQPAASETSQILESAFFDQDKEMWWGRRLPAELQTRWDTWYGLKTALGTYETPDVAIALKETLVAIDFHTVPLGGAFGDVDLGGLLQSASDSAPSMTKWAGLVRPVGVGLLCWWFIARSLFYIRFAMGTVGEVVSHDEV